MQHVNIKLGNQPVTERDRTIIPEGLRLCRAYKKLPRSKSLVVKVQKPLSTNMPGWNARLDTADGHVAVVSGSDAEGINHLMGEFFKLYWVVSVNRLGVVNFLRYAEPDEHF